MVSFVCLFHGSLHGCTTASSCWCSLTTTQRQQCCSFLLLHSQNGTQRKPLCFHSQCTDVASDLSLVSPSSQASSFFSPSSSSSSASLSSLASSFLSSAAFASSSSFFVLFSTSLKAFHLFAKASASALSSVMMTLSKMVPPLTCHRSNPTKPMSSNL